jgi:flagellar FliL protein
MQERRNGGTSGQNDASTPVDAKKSLFGKRLLLLGLPILLVQGCLAYFIVTKFFISSASTDEQEESIKKEDVEEERKIGEIYIIKDIIVNPAETRGKRFLNTTVAFEFKDSSVGNELVKRDVQIRDTLINIFVSKTVEELDGVEDKDKLRQEILEKVNAWLTTGKLKQVYFTSFVMQ